MTNTDDPGKPKSQPDAGKARRRVMVDGEPEPVREERAKKPQTRSLAEILGANEPNAAENANAPDAAAAAGAAYDPARLQAFLNGQITLGDLEGITKFEQYEMAKIGFSYLTSGKFAQAKTVFDGLVALDPYDAYFHTALGSIAQQQNDLPEADKRYTRALEINPFSPIALANRGEVRLLMGHLAEGAADLVKALEEDPGGQYPSTMRARATMQVLREQLQQQAGGLPTEPQEKKETGPRVPTTPAAKTASTPPPAPKAPATTVTAAKSVAAPTKPATPPPAQPAAAAKSGAAWPTAKPAAASAAPGKLETTKPAAEAAKPAEPAKAAKPAEKAAPEADSKAAPRSTRRGPRAGANAPGKKKK